MQQDLNNTIKMQQDLDNTIKMQQDLDNAIKMQNFNYACTILCQDGIIANNYIKIALKNTNKESKKKAIDIFLKFFDNNSTDLYVKMLINIGISINTDLEEVIESYTEINQLWIAFGFLINKNYEKMTLLIESILLDLDINKPILFENRKIMLHVFNNAMNILII